MTTVNYLPKGHISTKIVLTPYLVNQTDLWFRVCLLSKFPEFSLEINQNVVSCCSDAQCDKRPIQYRHNGRDGVSNHRPQHCFLNRLFKRRTMKIPKLHVNGLSAGLHCWPVNSPHKWPVARSCFHLMTSSCAIEIRFTHVTHTNLQYITWNIHEALMCLSLLW